MAVAIKAWARSDRPSKPQMFATYAADAFVLLLGLTVPFSVRFVGDLPVAEALLILSLPVLVFSEGRRALRPQLKIVYALMALWLLGLVVSDAFNQIPGIDRLRGNALILFFGLDLLGLSILTGRNDRRKVLLFVGLTIGALASVKLQPSDAAADYPWKFGYAWGTMQVALLLSYFFYRQRRYLAASIPILIICAVNLAFNFRSPVLTFLVMLVLVFPVIPERLGGLQILPRPGSALRVIVLAGFALGAGAVAGALVNYVTSAGYIGQDAKAKNEAQANAGNLLLGGRPEFLIGLRAALDSPIIGHGSWAKDLKYYEMLTDAMIEKGVLPEATGDIDEDADGLIPGHSHIVTAWVWAGIAGPIFWLYILWITVKSLVQISSSRPALAPLYGYMFVGLVWDIFFSPFAFNRRFTEAFAIVIMADLLEWRVPVVARTWIRSRNFSRAFVQSHRLPIQRNP